MKTITCTRTSYIPIFYGYDQSDVDTVLLYTYKANGNFDTLDSVLTFLYPDSIYNYYYSQGPDTQLYYKYGFGTLQLYPGYDYEIAIPSTHQLLRIYDIVDTADRTELVECRFPGSCYTRGATKIVSGGSYTERSGFAPVNYLLFSKP